MDITTRSVNRIVAILEEAGCVTTAGKRSGKKGRPARIMKITLLDYKQALKLNIWLIQHPVT